MIVLLQDIKRRKSLEVSKTKKIFGYLFEGTDSIFNKFLPFVKENYQDLENLIEGVFNTLCNGVCDSTAFCYSLSFENCEYRLEDTITVLEREDDGIKVVRIIRDLSTEVDFDNVMKALNVFPDVGVVVYNDEGIVYVNKAFCEALGVSKEEVLGKKVSQFLVGYSKDLAKKAEERLERGKKVGISRSRLVFRTNTGEMRYAFSVTTSIYYKNKLSNFALLFDITRLKLLEDLQNSRKFLIDADSDVRLFKNLCSYIVDHIGFAAGAFFSVCGEEDLVPVVRKVKPGKESIFRAFVEMEEFHRATGKCILTGEAKHGTVFINNAVFSYCIVPIRDRSSFYLFCIFSDSPMVFTADAQEVLNSLKTDIELALLRIKTSKELYWKSLFYSVLSCVSSAAFQAKSEKELMNRVLQCFSEHELFKSVIYIPEDISEGERLYFQSLRGVDLSQMKAYYTVPIFKEGRKVGKFQVFLDRVEDFGDEVQPLLSEVSKILSHALERLEVRIRNSLLSTALDNAFELVAILDENYRFVWVNDSVVKRGGYTKDELIGKFFLIFMRGITAKGMLRRIYTCLKENKTFSDVLLYRSKMGNILETFTTIVPCFAGGKRYYVVIGKDLSYEEELRESLSRLVNYDPVTDLPNHRYFLETMEKHLTDMLHTGGKGVLLILDPSDINSINRIYGYHVGDKVLAEIALRLRRTVRNYDILGFLKGGKFGLFAKNIDSRKNVISILNKVLEKLSEPVVVGNRKFDMNFTAGICFFPSDAHTAVELLSKAETALFKCKEENLRFRFYSKEDEEELYKQYLLVKKLNRYLSEGRIVLFYQPYVNSVTGKIEGAEVLLRFMDENGNYLLPSSFIDVLEKTEIMERTEEKILEHLREALLRQMRTKRKVVPISVNISPAGFLSGRVKRNIKKLVDAVKGYKSNGNGLLSIEIVERIFIRDFQKTKNLLQDIKSMGVNIILDDFGTGYSSLSYVSHLPLDVIKIDISFVRNIETSKTTLSLVKAVVAMSKELGIKTVAEGVETKRQVEILRELGVDWLQGFYFYKPMPEEEFLKLM